MPKYAGLDWSGTPDKNRSGLYVPCLIVVECDLDDLRKSFQQARRKYRMKDQSEFHAHDISDEMREEVLTIASAYGLRISAILYDKLMEPGNPGLFPLPKPADLICESAKKVVAPVIAQHRLDGLWCDEDVKGERQKYLKSAIQNSHRSEWPESRMEVRFRKSNDSELIQIADCCALGLARLEQGTIKSATLRRSLEIIRNNRKNRIVGPVVWGEENG